MSREQIRAACVEVFARVTYERIRQANPNWPWGTEHNLESREPWEALTGEQKELWLGLEQRMAPYVDALIDAGILAPEPAGYVVFSNRTFTTPVPLRDAHVRLTRTEADHVHAILTDRAAANPQWSRGIAYLIGGIHPLSPAPAVTE